MLSFASLVIIRVRGMTTYIGFQLSLEDLASLLVDSLHGIVLVNLSTEFTSCIGCDLRD